MVELTALRQRLVDGPDSLGERNRARRWQWLQDTFPDLSSMSVIDLGGTVEAWLRAPLRPAAVHVVNLEPQPGTTPDWLTAEQGDACALPPSLDGASYDLVFSNSVIEHVGGHAQRLRFAAEVHRLAARHWIQTPYRYFPIEPHWLFPGFQFMPVDVGSRYEVVQWLIFQAASMGPMLGQAHHFLKFNPGKSSYAEERYGKEAKRLWGVLDRRLAQVEYVAGDYSIADIAIFPWISRFHWQGVRFGDHPNVLRWYLAIVARPAVERGFDVPERRHIPIPSDG